MSTAKRVLVAGVLVFAAVLAACTGRAPAARTGPSHPASANPLHAAPNYDPSLPGAVACSSLIVSGTVVAVVDGAPGRMVTTLRVADWVKPASGPATTTVDTVDIAAGGQYARWQPGQRLNLAVDVDPSVLPNWELDARQFARYRAAAAGAAALQCPYGPA